MAPNILLSLALIRIARPYVKMLLANSRLGCLHPARLDTSCGAAGNGEDCRLRRGRDGCGRCSAYASAMYVDGISAVGSVGETQRSSASALAATETAGLMRLLACLVAAVVFVWQEQEEFSFPAIHLAVFILGLGVLSISLCLFKRGESRIQPPEPIAGTLRFVGRHTLEIYAIQLAGSELLVKLGARSLPDPRLAHKATWRAIRAGRRRSQQRQPHPGHGAIDLRTGQRTPVGGTLRPHQAVYF